MEWGLAINIFWYPGFADMGIKKFGMLAWELISTVVMYLGFLFSWEASGPLRSTTSAILVNDTMGSL